MKTSKNKQEQGQILVIFAIALIALMGLTGLGLDVGMLYSSRQNAQSAADAAAFAGGVAKIKNQDVVIAATNQAATDGFDGINNNQVVVNNPPISGPYVGSADYVQVIITTHIQTMLIHLFYSGASATTVKSVVYANPEGEPLAGDDVMMGANKTDCDTVLINGGVIITVSGGGNIRANSKAEDCYAMVTNGSSGSIITNDGGTTQVVGGFNNSGHLIVSPPPVTPAIQKTVVDFPAPSCTAPSNFGGISQPDPEDRVNVQVSGPLTLNPGAYGSINVKNNGVLTLTPGLYCFGTVEVEADITNKGNILGSDVLLVVNGAMDFGGGNTISLSANQTDPYNLIDVDGNTTNYKGMLIYSKFSTDYTLNGNGITNYTGTIYLPNANCTINGNNSGVLLDTQMICDKIVVGGNGNLQFTYNGSHLTTAGGTLSLMK